MSFIYVGRFDELKGIKLLFEAWRLMGKNAPTLRVCGSGPLNDWCHEYIEKNGLENIMMMGKVDNNKVKEMLAESEALIVPSLWYEGFPMTIVEAYSVGTPVIGSNVGNVKDIVKDHVTGLVFNKDDVHDLVRQVNNIRGLNLRGEVQKEYQKYKADENYEIMSEIYHRATQEAAC